MGSFFWIIVKKWLLKGDDVSSNLLNYWWPPLKGWFIGFSFFVCERVMQSSLPPSSISALLSKLIKTLQSMLCRVIKEEFISVHEAAPPLCMVLERPRWVSPCPCSETAPTLLEEWILRGSSRLMAPNRSSPYGVWCATCPTVTPWLNEWCEPYCPFPPVKPSG